MGKVTWIKTDDNDENYTALFIDYKFFASIETRKFNSMLIKDGDIVDADELKEKTRFFWKKAYGKKSWEKEKIRLEKVINLIQNIRSDLSIKETGFGADTTDLIEEHPDEAGSPDLTIYNKDSIPLLYVEVTGTENKRGNDYWIRPDKIKYFQNHKEQNIWIILYFNSNDQFVFIKPKEDNEYNFVKKIIRGNEEHYVVFNDASPEVKTKDIFISEIKAL